MNEKVERVKDFLAQNVGYFVVGLVCVIYLASAFITIGKTGKTVGEIIADGAISLALGLFINRVFDLQGMMNGDKEDKVQATYTLHNDTVVKISPYIDRLDDWCKTKNEENLKMQRTRILASEGMKYSDYFDESGAAKDFKVNKDKLKDKILRKDEKNRIRCFRKALRLKLTPMTAGSLTSEGGKAQDPYFFGRTKAQYETESGLQDLVCKILICCIIGYYGVDIIRNFSYANLVWKALQVGLFLIMGVIKMYVSYVFVVEEYRGRIIKKIDNLQMFQNYINNSKNISIEVQENDN